MTEIRKEGEGSRDGKWAMEEKKAMRCRRRKGGSEKKMEEKEQKEGDIIKRKGNSRK